ncbi:MAG: tetratricopeptide repeat protein [Lentisphaeraceae bacterium]|nr:tetratricopeptide repeat protein [Lentisphaeraceae bacterium]
MNSKTIPGIIFFAVCGLTIYLLIPKDRHLFEMYYQSNKLEEAKEYLADHCEKNPQDLPLRYKYINLLDRLADEDEYRELLKAKNDFPEEIKVRELLTKFYEDSGEPEKAALERDEMLFTQLTPPLKKNDYFKLCRKQLSYYQLTQNFQKEQQLLNELLRTYNEEDAHFMKLEFLHRYKKLDELKDSLPTVLKLEKLSAESYRKLSWYHLLLADYPKALISLEEGLAKYPADQKLHVLNDQIKYIQALGEGPQGIQKYIENALSSSNAHYKIDYSFLMQLAIEHKLNDSAYQSAVKIVENTGPEPEVVTNLYYEMKEQLQDPRKYHLLDKIFEMGNTIKVLQKAHAFTLMEQEKYQDALPLWKKVLADDPTVETVLSYLLCLQNVKDPQYSEELAKFQKMFPENITLLQMAAYNAEADKEFKTAAALWHKLLKADSSAPETHLNYLNLVSQAKDEEALKNYLIDYGSFFPENETFQTTLAFTVQNFELWKPAADRWAQVLKINAKSSTALENEFFCISKLEANEIVKRLEFRIKQHPDEEMKSKAADLLITKKEFKTAIPILKSLIVTQPNKLQYRESLLFALNEAESREEYSVELGKTVSQFPDNDKLRVELAYALQNQKEWSKAAQHWNQLINKDETNATYWENYLFCAQNLDEKEYSDALLKAAELFKDDPEKFKIAADHINDLEKDKALKIYTGLIEKNGANLLLARNALLHLEKNSPFFKELAPYLAKLKPAELSQSEQLILIDYYEMTNDIPKAEALIAKIAKEQPENSDLKLRQAYLLSSSSRFNEALEIFLDLYKTRPEKNEMAEMVIYTAQKSNNSKVLKEFLAELYSKEPENSKYLLLYAGLIRDEDPEKADKLIDTLLQQRKAQNSVEELDRLSKELLDNQFIRQAEKAVDQLLVLSPEYPPALKRKANILSWNNQAEQAEPYLRKYLEKEPEDATAIHDLASILQIRSGTDAAAKDESVKLFNKVLELLDKGWQGENRTLLKARSLSGTGRVLEAIPYFEEILRENPQDGYLYGDYAEALINVKLFPEAEDVLKRAPKFGKFRLRNQRLEGRLYMEQKDYVRAIDFLGAMHKEYPEDIGILLDLAYCRVLTDQPYYALKLYKKAYDELEKTSDSYRIVRNDLINTQRPYGDQIGIEFYNAGYGSSIFDKTTVHYKKHLNEEFQLEGSAQQYFIRGPGFPGEKDSREYLSTLENDINFRPGDRWKFTLGHIYSRNESDDWHGFHAAVSKGFKELSLSVDYKHRKSWYDPTSVVERSGAENVLSLYAEYRLNERITLSQRISYDEKYLLRPDSGDPQDVYNSLESMTGVDLLVYNDPEIHLFYRFQWKDGNLNSDYDGRIFLEEERRTHYLGARAFYQVNDDLQIFGSISLAHDSSRQIDFDPDDFLAFGLGFNWRMCENVDLLGNYYESTENLSGQQGRYNEISLKLVYHF